MKKTIVLICGALLIVFCQFALPVSALSEEKIAIISDHCESIRDSLKTTQKNDAKARVYLGRRYETIFNNYIVPLNVKLVENNISNADMVKLQNEFADSKGVFANDYVNYQQVLEELVGMDCKKEPEPFYEKLELTRKKRKTVEQDVLKLRDLLSQYTKLLNKIRGKLNEQ